MLYLAIDRHRKQLTVNLRNEQGDVLVKRQVSTEWPRGRGGVPRTTGTGDRDGPGGLGRLPARGSHRPERAQLTHSVPQIVISLRYGAPRGSCEDTARDSESVDCETSPTKLAMHAADA